MPQSTTTTRAATRSRPLKRASFTGRSRRCAASQDVRLKSARGCGSWCGELEWSAEHADYSLPAQINACGVRISHRAGCESANLYPLVYFFERSTMSQVNQAGIDSQQQLVSE